MLADVAGVAFFQPSEASFSPAWAPTVLDFPVAADIHSHQVNSMVDAIGRASTFAYHSRFIGREFRINSDSYSHWAYFQLIFHRSASSLQIFTIGNVVRFYPKRATGIGCVGASINNATTSSVGIVCNRRDVGNFSILITSVEPTSITSTITKLIIVSAAHYLLGGGHITHIILNGSRSRQWCQTRKSITGSTPSLILDWQSIQVLQCSILYWVIIVKNARCVRMILLTNYRAIVFISNPRVIIILTSDNRIIILTSNKRLVIFFISNDREFIIILPYIICLWLNAIGRRKQS